MAGTPQANSAKRNAGGRPLGPRRTRRDRPVRSDPIRSAITRGGCETNQLSNTSETERAIAVFASQPNGGLIVSASALTVSHRELINTLAAKHKLPAVVPSRVYMTGGALISYGVDFIDQHRRAAGYVDRILKGEKPADLPVQAPTKYELAINLKAAKALGITVPPALLAQANDVIE